MLSPLRSLLVLTTALACALTASAAMAAPARHPAGAAHAAPAFKALPSIAAPDDLWDFASWDSEHNHLLVAHGKDVLVIDPSIRAVRSIGQIGYAHAVLPLPGTDGRTAYVMAAKAGAISVVDLNRMVETGRIPLKTGLWR